MPKPNILIRRKKAKAVDLLNNNQLREADVQFASICLIAPADAETWAIRGLIHRKLGLFNESLDYCKRALKFKPDYAWAHHILGSALQCQNRIDDAISSYRRAIQLKPDFAETHYFLANALREIDMMDAAVASYREAIKIQPGFIEALCNLGAALTHLGNTEEATKVLNEANQLRPNMPQILCNQGEIFKRAGRLTEALVKYQRALLQNPNFSDAICNAATLLEKTNRFDEAKALVDSELPRSPENPLLLITAARLARRVKKLDEAIFLLEKASKLNLDLATSGDVQLLLGQIHDSCGNTERAYTHFVEGNKFFARTLEGGNQDRYFERLEKIRGWITPELPKSSETDLDINSDPPPIFLFGFPRSGTTLLEQILDSHPALQSLEEKPTVSVMVKEFEVMAQGRQNALAELTPDQVLQLRKIYFHEVAQHIKLQPGQLLVDKFPLNTINAHLIWRVFPRAKLILAIRHPCDVCLSCFMQNIALNDEATNFLTLEGVAKVYSKVMSLWQDYAHALPLNFHRIRYEDLITDFETETRSLLDFLEVGWDDSVLNHTNHALKRGTINTPSYHQVTQPIYQHAKFRWKRYAKQFEPLMPALKPFIDYYGYDD